MYHALIDLGDVLINVDNAGHMEALHQLMPGYPAEEIDAVINKSNEGTALRHQLDCGTINFDQYQRSFEQMFRVSINPEAFSRVYRDRLTLNTPVSNMFKTLTEIGAIKKIVIVSNTDPVSWIKAMELLTLADLQIHCVVASYMIGKRKPDPAMFTAALEVARARPEECCFVDDKIANVDAAQALSIAGIHYRAGNPDAQKFLIHDLEKLGIRV